MARVRCTCIYATRPAHDGPRPAVVSVVTRDPWCPAADLHEPRGSAPDDEQSPR